MCTVCSIKYMIFLSNIIKLFLFLKAYFNDNALTLIRTLITGGTTPEFEQMLAEESEMREGLDKMENRNRPRLSQICLLDVKYAKFGVNLREKNILFFLVRF